MNKLCIVAAVVCMAAMTSGCVDRRGGRSFAAGVAGGVVGGVIGSALVAPHPAPVYQSTCFQQMVGRDVWGRPVYQMICR
jgi:hypothetical protein